MPPTKAAPAKATTAPAPAKPDVPETTEADRLPAGAMTNPDESDRQTDQPGAPDVPGQTADVEVVEEGPSLDRVTDAQATHSTGTHPDGGQPDSDVNAAIRQGIAPQPVPAPATVLLSTPGGYQVVPAGVDQEDIGSNAVSRG